MTREDTPAEGNDDATRGAPARPEGLLEQLKERLGRLDVIDRWGEATQREVAQEPFQRDADFLRMLVPLMEVFGRYFDSEVRHFERVPESPALLVGNHSGGVLTPDTAAVMSTWYSQRGYDDVLVGLAFDAAFSIPVFKDLMRKIGQVPASSKNAEKALGEGRSVLVYPGGSHEVFRPYSARNQIDFGGHRGFIRTALRAQVPVVPIVGHGGHETTVVLSRGERLAQLFKMERIRMGQYPILFQLPWGVSTPAFIGMPLPAKITVDVQQPIDWRGTYSAEDASDPAVLDRCYEEVMDVMQSALTRLAEENPNPLRSRLESLVGRGPSK